MKKRTNRDRANRAGLAVGMYLQGDTLDESSVRDLITDLFHLLKTQDKTVSYELKVAIETYMEEYELEENQDHVNDRPLRLAVNLLNQLSL